MKPGNFGPTFDRFIYFRSQTNNYKLANRLTVPDASPNYIHIINKHDKEGKNKNEEKTETLCRLKVESKTKLANGAAKSAKIFGRKKRHN